MRYLYGIDSGQSFNDWRESFLVRENIRSPAFSGSEEMAQSASLSFSEELRIKSEVKDCVDSLHEKGFYIFKTQLPMQLVSEIVDATKNLPVASPDTNHEVVGIDAALATGERRFDFNESDIFRVTAVGDLLIDPTWPRITENYLGVGSVVQDQIAMWISLPSDDDKKSNAAQMFHYDLDRPAFLKFFILLTDVGPSNGPHVVVPRSHLASPKHFRQPRRYSDQEVAGEWPNNETKIMGKAGTIFAVDTKCLHKGLELKEGFRTILQFEFADSLFGAPYTKIAVPKGCNLAQAKTSKPRCFQRFRIDEQ